MIKNIVFDIGNVLIRWEPENVVARLFPEDDIEKLTHSFFKSETWQDLNRGKITEPELLQIYNQQYGVDLAKLQILMHEVKESLLPIENSFDLLANLRSKYTLYALTDNVKEFIVYLRDKYDFWRHFNGVVVSADIGFLKPAPEIYQHLLSTYTLIPSETVFIDDCLPNVQGAKSLGMHAIKFTNVAQCIHEMRALNIHICK